jgi:hypothetical protein
MKNLKTLKHLQTAADRRVKSDDTINPPFGLSDIGTIFGEWRRLLPTSASGQFLSK